MDGDDISHPKRLEKQVEYLARNPTCGIAGTGFLDIDCNGRIIRGYQLPDDHDFLLSWLKKGVNVYRHSSIILRKSVLNKLPDWYRFSYGEDFDLYLRLCEISRLGLVQEVLLKYRVFGAGIQGIVSSIQERQKALMMELYFRRQRGECEGDWRRIEKEILLSLNCDAEDCRKTHNSYANATSLFQEGRFKDARKYFIEAATNARYKENARRYIVLTFLPKRIGLMLQRAFSYKRDKWKSYQIPPGLWPHINEGFQERTASSKAVS
jgi:hypothetical protein